MPAGTDQKRPQENPALSSQSVRKRDQTGQKHIHHTCSTPNKHYKKSHGPQSLPHQEPTVWFLSIIPPVRTRWRSSPAWRLGDRPTFNLCPTVTRWHHLSGTAAAKTCGQSPVFTAMRRPLSSSPWCTAAVTEEGHRLSSSLCNNKTIQLSPPPQELGVECYIASLPSSNTALTSLCPIREWEGGKKKGFSKYVYALLSEPCVKLNNKDTAKNLRTKHWSVIPFSSRTGLG